MQNLKNDFIGLLVEVFSTVLFCGLIYAAGLWIVG